MTLLADSDQTASLCPVCLERLDARREGRGGRVFLVKDCPEHGRFETLIWEGLPDFDSWKRPKIPAAPPVAFHETDRGCPFDCGLCPDHRQRSCTVILEVTGRCDLGCSFCYADAGKQSGPDPDFDQIDRWYRIAAEGATSAHIQLSGGEPTLRDDLPDLTALGRERGFDFIQVNTNGLRLARDDAFVRDLKAAGLGSVFLQFDGLEPRTWEAIRGRDLLKEKLAAVEACGRHGLGVVLVPTLVPGVNTGEVGRIVQKALELAPVVRAVHFQPVSYFGRFPGAPPNGDRLTLPSLMRSLEEQTGGLIKASDFKPPGCENALCSFHAGYLISPGGGLKLLSGGLSCCSGEPIPAWEGAARTTARVARQWSAPQGTGRPLTPIGPIVTSRREDDGPASLDEFLNQARQNTFSVSAMAFQDAWNLDLERLRDCCIHIMSPSGQLTPFCAYNLTSQDGRSLYR